MAMPMMPPRRGVGAPNTGTAPPQQDPMAMMGGQGETGQPEMGPQTPMAQNPQIDQMRTQFLNQLRQLVSQLDAVAQQYPAFAPFGEQMMQIAQEGMTQVIAALGQQQPPQNPMAMM